MRGLAGFFTKSAPRKEVGASEAKPLGRELTAERQSHAFKIEGFKQDSIDCFVA